ncbi:MAG: MFS transporter [Candidatus Rhabdochlamydia sp.]
MDNPSYSHKRTWLSMTLSGLLSEPLTCFVAMLPFILRKELHVTGGQIALLNMIKPVVSLFSFYWGSALTYQKEKLRSNWITASLLARLPFLLFPFMSDPYLFIASLAIFHFFQKGSLPAHMEVLKQNAPPGIRETIFSWTAASNFFLSIVLGCFIGSWMDHHREMWKMLFFAGGFIGLLSILIQAKMPILLQEGASKPSGSFFKTPWKDSLTLLKRRPDFARFQIGFMLGGTGLMMVMPALVIYTADDLLLTHSMVAWGRFVWMGLGFVMAIPFWRKQISYENIFLMTSLANLFFALGAFSWMIAFWYPVMFYCAFFLYGIAQAGSHLSWHLSGPLFAGEEGSTPFSTVNVLTVGLRGVLIPGISTLLCEFTGPFPVLFLGALFCLTGFFYLAWVRHEQQKSLLLTRETPNT